MLSVILLLLSSNALSVRLLSVVRSGSGDVDGLYSPITVWTGISPIWARSGGHSVSCCSAFIRISDSDWWEIWGVWICGWWGGGISSRLWGCWYCGIWDMSCICAWGIGPGTPWPGILPLAYGPSRTTGGRPRFLGVKLSAPWYLIMWFFKFCLVLYSAPQCSQVSLFPPVWSFSCAVSILL